MRFATILLLALAVNIVCVSGFNGIFDRRNHIGALNRGLEKQIRHQKHLLSKGIAPNDDAKWFSQSVDHFNPNSHINFIQKYYVNTTQYISGGPVFFMLGGEGIISADYMSGHFIINNYAEKYHAFMVTLEHRFYGSSIPNNSSTTDNLRLLTSEQAIADAATFREFIQQQYNLPTNTKWIVFGGSYSGSLSAWARLKYPHLFHGSIAASAPILAQLDFPQYFEVVQASIGEKCASIWSSATKSMEASAKTPEGLADLSKLFNTCSPIMTQDDIITFFSSVSNGPSGVVQYNDDNNSYQTYDITKMCAMLENSMSQGQTAVQAVANFVNLNDGGACMEVNYTAMIQEYQPTSDGRSWTYQTCVEFGYYQTGESSDQPFSSLISLASFLKLCVDIFGVPNMTPNIDWTNNNYGALLIETSNTVFSNGNIDPWHKLGETVKVDGDSNIVLFMNGTAHCADLYPPRASDLPELTHTRTVTQQYLDQWLA